MTRSADRFFIIVHRGMCVPHTEILLSLPIAIPRGTVPHLRRRGRGFESPRCVPTPTQRAISSGSVNE